MNFAVKPNRTLRQQPSLSSRATGFLTGRVAHCRFQPRVHKFSYSYGCFWLALDRLEQARQEQPNWFSSGPGWVKYRRKDHIGPEDQDLASYIRELTKLDKSPDNEVFFLGQLNYLGRYFSPVNFFFIGSQQGTADNPSGEFAFHTLVAEVSNTPWNEKHHYIVPLTNSRKPYRQRKTFHVSPFMETRQEYHWQIHYDNDDFAITIHSTQDKRRQFTAALKLSAETLNHSKLLPVLVSNVVMVAAVKLRIYWQAVKLFCKGIRYQSYPGPTGNQNTTTSQLELAEDKDGHRSL
ncbi:MAG: DUF1365 domain-containing protein [Candidatus Pelagadaptatus aseana]|uniref:DUF1365 domain-containing protein n=1 Tax=Candidatus Pelagadaptatus aseana TaxID=3120508 RepID=UPI0039B346E1